MKFPVASRVLIGGIIVLELILTAIYLLSWPRFFGVLSGND